MISLDLLGQLKNWHTFGKNNLLLNEISKLQKWKEKIATRKVNNVKFINQC